MREDMVPLRTVLQNFINHVEGIEARRTDGEDQYDSEFQELKDITEDLKNRPGFECSEGEKEINRRKNRYKDILPYDYSRVSLVGSGSEGDDYINANYIRGAGGSRAYIASQGPLQHTLSDFWLMVVECDVQVIVMASNETEGGKTKCECYWVCSKEEDRHFGDVHVSFVKCRQVCPDFLVRTLKITFTNSSGERESRLVCQFHYSLWPDHGVPETVRPLLAMVKLVRECQASETLPLLVHCSAGCGRTGTICAIDHVWTLLRTGRLPERVDLLSIVKDMRRQRVAMVQTKDQYVLLHRAVKRLFMDRLALIDDHPYANVGFDGTPLGEINSSLHQDILSEKTAVASPLQSSSTEPSFKGVSSPFSLPLNGHSLHHSSTPSTPNNHHPPFHLTHSSREGSRSNSKSSLLDEVDSPRSSSLNKYNSPLGTPYGTPMGTPGSTPAATPTTTPNSFQGIGLNTPPTRQPPPPPTRSHTPSPIISFNRKSSDLSYNSSADKRTSDTSPSDTQSKSHRSTNLKRRPSVQKFKELFEFKSSTSSSGENSDNSSPVVKLSRSASSVTLRNNAQLSVQSSRNENTDRSLRWKRKGYLGSQENIPSNGESNSRSHISICPPPPSIVDQIGSKLSRSKEKLLDHHIDVSKSADFSATGKPPSSPIMSSPSSRRRHLGKVVSSSTNDYEQMCSEKPALPIKIKKKSKSFRYSREHLGNNANENYNNVTGSDVTNKGHVDVANYFSLDRNKNDYLTTSLNDKLQDGCDISEEIKKLQFSIYSDNDDRNSTEIKPQIPPKKSALARLKSCVIPSESKDRNENLNLRFNNRGDYKSHLDQNIHSTPLSSYKSSPSSDSEQSLYDLLPSVYNKNQKSYQNNNNKNVRTPTEDRNNFIPLPTKRTSTEGKKGHDYANFSVGLANELTLSDDSRANNTSSDSHPSPTFNRVSRSLDTKYMDSIDFGENSGEGSEIEVVEVFNKALVGADNSKSHDITHNSLDPIAKLVYKDCEEYLLHGTNKSPVPSLMPKHETNSLSSNKSSSSRGSDKSRKQDNDVTKGVRKTYSMDVQDLTSKINIIPQGLRTRERRNSYRQAVNPLVANWRAEKMHRNVEDIGKKLGHNIIEASDETNSQSSSSQDGAPVQAMKGGIHKYETIWFEKTRETSRSDENMKPFHNFSEGQINIEKKSSANTSSPVWVKKDKLTKEEDTHSEGLQGFVNSLERSRMMKESVEPSVLNSMNRKGAPSSVQLRNVSRKEPIYVNTNRIIQQKNFTNEHQPNSLPIRTTYESRKSDGKPHGKSLAPLTASYESFPMINKPPAPLSSNVKHNSSRSPDYIKVAGSAKGAVSTNSIYGQILQPPTTEEPLYNTPIGEPTYVSRSQPSARNYPKNSSSKYQPSETPKRSHQSRATTKGNVAFVGGAAVRLRRPRDRSVGTELGAKSPDDGHGSPIAPPRIKRHSSMSGGRDSCGDYLPSGSVEDGHHQVNDSSNRKSEKYDNLDGFGSPPALPAKTNRHYNPLTPAPPPSMHPAPSIHPHNSPNHPHNSSNHPHSSPNHPHNSPNHPHNSPSNHHLKRYSYHSSSNNSPSSTLTASGLNVRHTPYMHPPPPKPYLPPKHSYQLPQLSPPHVNTSHNHPQTPPQALQRSVTSSAILISPKISEQAKKNKQLNGRTNILDQNSDPEGPGEVIPGDSTDLGNGGTSQTNGRDIDSRNTPNGSKFSGWYKKLKSGVTPTSKYGMVQSKQSFVHPNKISSDKVDSAITSEQVGSLEIKKSKSSSSKRTNGFGASYKKQSIDQVIDEENQDSSNSSNKTSSKKFSKQSTKIKNSKNNSKSSTKSRASEEGSNLQSNTPTSPKPLVRALGKLKFLKSGGTPDDSSEGVVTPYRGNPLQKSSSVGHSMFNAVVQECGFPRSSKGRETSISPPPARQQYL